MKIAATGSSLFHIPRKLSPTYQAHHLRLFYPFCSVFSSCEGLEVRRARVQQHYGVLVDVGTCCGIYQSPVAMAVACVRVALVVK